MLIGQDQTQQGIIVSPRYSIDEMQSNLVDQLQTKRRHSKRGSQINSKKKTVLLREEAFFRENLKNIIQNLKVKAITRRFIQVLKTRSGNSYQNLSAPQKRQLLSLFDKRFLPDSDSTLGEKIKVFQVDSLITIGWDIFMILVILLVLIWQPMQISFQIVSDLTSQGIENMIVLAQFMDIICYLNRVQIKRGRVISDRKQIVKDYVKHQMLYDSIQVLSLFFGRIVEVKWISSILYGTYIFCRFFKLQKLVDKYIEYFNISGQTQDVLRLTNMFFFVSYVVHILACIWHAVGRFSGEQDNWMVMAQIDHQTIPVRYCVSFYWAAMTVTTVGYGDITPRNIYEYICANIIMIVVSIVFGFTLNSIGQLITNISQREKEFKKNLIILNRYMEKNKINYQLQCKVRSYLEYMKWSKMNDDSEADGLINSLSNSLQEEIKRYTQGTALNKIPILKNFSADFNNNLTKIIEKSDFVPEQNLDLNSNHEDISLYYLQQGQIQIISSKKQVFDHIPIMEGGVTIGIQSFFSNQKMHESFNCLEYTTLLKISLRKFHELIQNFQEDLERFCMLKDESTHDNNLNQKIICQICRTTHQIMKCPLTCYQVDREKIIKQSLFPSQQKRRRFQRIGFRSNSFKIYQSVVFKQKYLSERLVERGSHQSIIERFEDALDTDERQVVPLNRCLSPKLILPASENTIDKMAYSPIKYVSSLKYIPPPKEKSGEQVDEVEEFPSSSQLPNQHPQQFFQIDQFDKMKNYKVFYPQNNCDVILKKQILRSIFRGFRDQKTIQEELMSRYSFDQKIIKLFQKYYYKSTI